MIPLRCSLKKEPVELLESNSVFAVFIGEASGVSGIQIES